MSLNQVLEANNITASQAWDFIVVNIDNPELIFSEVNKAGLSFDMLTELVSQFDSGISAGAVSEYFTQAGLNLSELTVDLTPPSEPTVENAAQVGSNSEGVIVIDPVGPITGEQATFIAGLLESAELAFVPGDEDGVLLNEVSTEGLFINVRFDDTDYTDLIFALEDEDYQTIQSVGGVAVDQVYLGALQQAGYDSFESFNATGTQDEAAAILDTVESIINDYTQPKYDAMFASESDLWTFV